MEPSEQADLDQILASMLDEIPAMAMRFYERFVEVGFSQGRAFELTRIYVQGAMGPAAIFEDSE